MCWARLHSFCFMPITDACTCCGGSRCGGVQCDKTCHMPKGNGERSNGVMEWWTVMEGSVTEHAACLVYLLLQFQFSFGLF